MSAARMEELWPWLALAGLGFYHGINPTMGWLFAVALGLHRRSFRAVLLSLVPIALGHATAIALVLGAALALGLVVDPVIVGRVAAVLLIGWAVWHVVRGHRQRPRVEWIGLAFLRSHWINLDLIWIAGLGLSGALLMLA